MKDLIIVGGAPGVGKTIISDLLAKELNSFVFDFGILREVHLDNEWLNEGKKEEQMAFENLLYIIENYKKNDYKNVILNDLQDFRIQQLPEVFSEFDYIIISLFVKDDEELANRIKTHDSGFKNTQKAIEWNKGVIDRKKVKNEFKIDNTHNDPYKTLSQILKLLN